jgi:hypothetical protein
MKFNGRQRYIQNATRYLQMNLWRVLLFCEQNLISQVLFCARTVCQEKVAMITEKKLRTS